MDIYINRNGQQGGPYSLDKINECLAEGSMQPADLAFHKGLAGWVPLSQIVGVIDSGTSLTQPPLSKPEGVSAVSPKSNINGKLLIFGGIGVGLIVACIAVGFFVFGWGNNEPSQKNARGSTPKPTLPSPPSVKTNDSPVKPQTLLPKVVSINLKGYTAIEDGIRSALDKPTGELTPADFAKVKELYMPYDEIIDLEALAGLANLEELSLFNNQITNLTPLAEIKGLKRLIIYDNPTLTKTEINKLQQALPNCKISHNAKK